MATEIMNIWVEISSNNLDLRQARRERFGRASLPGEHDGSLVRKPAKRYMGTLLGFILKGPQFINETFSVLSLKVCNFVAHKVVSSSPTFLVLKLDGS